MTSRTEDLHVKIDEKHTVAEASKTRQNAEYELIATTSVDIIKHTGNTVTAVHESSHKEFEKIDVLVYLERAVNEEITVVLLNTDHTTLTASKGTKNKFDEVSIDWNSTES